MAVDPVAVTASQSADVTDELVGDAVAAHVYRVQHVVVEHDAAIPAERGEVLRRRRAGTGRRHEATDPEPRLLGVGVTLTIPGRLYRHVPGPSAVATNPSRRGKVDDGVSVSGLADIRFRSGCGCVAIRVVDVRWKFVAETLSRRMRKVVVDSTVNYDAFVVLRHFRIWAAIDCDIRWRRRQVARTSFYFRFRWNPVLH